MQLHPQVCLKAEKLCPKKDKFSNPNYIPRHEFNDMSYATMNKFYPANQILQTSASRKLSHNYKNTSTHNFLLNEL